MRAHRRREELLRHQGPALPPGRQPDDLGRGPVCLLPGLVRIAARGNAHGDGHHARFPAGDQFFHFNPFLPADPLEPVPDDQFEFCMGLLKLIAGPKLATPANEMAMRKGLAEFFNAYRMLLRNRKGQAPVPPLTLLSSILEMEIEHAELAGPFELWTVRRRAE